MPLTHDRCDFVEDSCRNISAIETHDSVAPTDTIQPSIGQPVATANTYGELTIARMNRVKGNRTVRLRSEFRKRNAHQAGRVRNALPKE